MTGPLTSPWSVLRGMSVPWLGHVAWAQRTGSLEIFHSRGTREAGDRGLVHTPRGWTFQVPGQTISPNIPGEVVQTMGLVSLPTPSAAALRQALRGRLNRQKHSGPPNWPACLCPRPWLSPGPLITPPALLSGAQNVPFPGRCPAPPRFFRRKGLLADTFCPPDIQACLAGVGKSGQWTESPSHPEPQPEASPLALADFPSLVQSRQH